MTLKQYLINKGMPAMDAVDVDFDLKHALDRKEKDTYRCYWLGQAQADFMHGSRKVEFVRSFTYKGLDRLIRKEYVSFM